VRKSLAFDHGMSVRCMENAWKMHADAKHRRAIVEREAFSPINQSSINQSIGAVTSRSNHTQKVL